MKSLFRGLGPLVLIAAMLLTLSGCDEPNTPDVPLRPYRLAAQYMTRGTAIDVEIAGNYVAVAEELLGAIVLDASDVQALDTVFVYTVSPGGSCTQVALDLLHSYLCVFPADGIYRSVFDFTYDNQWEAQVEGISLTLNGPLGEFAVTAVPDTILLWGSDISSSDNKFTAVLWFQPSDTSAWIDGAFPQLFIPAHGRVRGFDFRADGIAAIAIEQQGVQLHRLQPFERLGSVDTPGLAYDCAWYGNYVIVADQVQMVVVDASDLMNPRIVGQLRISKADRLRGVAMDGHFACLMDIYDGVYVVDVSNPTAPLFAQEIELFDPTSVAAGNGRLYVTDPGNGLLIYTR
ncbi:hypothetical protein KKH27_06045 [bacterium]|nr:hypothetical protein [bacterium]MBU1983426.1 hypothetical protein [bacterium]